MRHERKKNIYSNTHKHGEDGLFEGNPIRYSSYNVSNPFSMLVDKQLASPVRNGTILRVVYTTQHVRHKWLSSDGFKNNENSKNFFFKLQFEKNECGIILVTFIRNLIRKTSSADIKRMFREPEKLQLKLASLKSHRTFNETCLNIYKCIVENCFNIHIVKTVINKTVFMYS